MGYNNNHAGMHMIWYHRRNSYDDLEYYDRLAKREQKQKKSAKKVLEMDKEEIIVGVKPTVEVEQTKSQPQKKKKTQNNNQKSKQIEQPKKQKVIDDKYFKTTIDWYANIYLIAFERKIDIFDAVCECEHLCEEDLRMDERYCSLFEPVTVLDKTIVFLNMLADKMGCDVYEFIFPNADMRSRRVYRILDKLDERYCNDISSVCAFEYGVAGEREDEKDEEYIVERFALNEFMYLDIETSDGDIPECHMEYYFDKITAKDRSKKPEYAIIVSMKNRYLFSRNSQAFNYMFGGSEIINESEGRLADFFEKLKKVYLENGGTRDDYLCDLF